MKFTYVILRRIVDFIRSLTPLQATGNALAVQFNRVLELVVRRRLLRGITD
jgi:hypothetical protein